MNAGYWTARGIANFCLRRFETAVEEHNKTIKLDPTYGLYWNNHGEAMAGLNRYEEVVREISAKLSGWMIQSERKAGSVEVQRGQRGQSIFCRQ